ncbi:hypothetical protein [Pseudoalteromonas piscicida]|nr:hypothetical protein [Pseudoalteromonas piscicida]
MKRRTFLSLGTAITATSFMPFSCFASEQPLDFTIQNAQVTRLNPNVLSTLNIKSPIMSMESPTGEKVKVSRKAKIIRKYESGIYVYFELTTVIRVFSLSGQGMTDIELPKGIKDVKDFAIDFNLQQIYLLTPGSHQIAVVDFYGRQLATLGEFGYELESQLNGPKSITVDDRSRLHVVDASGNRVKVFDNNGAFSYSYGGSRVIKRKFNNIDGYQDITLTGGKLGDRRWVLDKKTNKLLALN